MAKQTCNQTYEAYTGLCETVDYALRQRDRYKEGGAMTRIEIRDTLTHLAKKHGQVDKNNYFVNHNPPGDLTPCLAKSDGDYIDKSLNAIKTVFSPFKAELQRKMTDRAVTRECIMQRVLTLTEPEMPLVYTNFDILDAIVFRRNKDRHFDWSWDNSAWNATTPMDINMNRRIFEERYEFSDGQVVYFYASQPLVPFGDFMYRLSGVQPYIHPRADISKFGQWLEKNSKRKTVALAKGEDSIEDALNRLMLTPDQFEMGKEILAKAQEKLLEEAREKKVRLAPATGLRIMLDFFHWDKSYYVGFICDTVLVSKAAYGISFHGSSLDDLAFDKVLLPTR